MSKQSTDHLLALAKAGLEAVPIIGGPLASLIGDYIPMSTERSIRRTVALLEQEVRRLQGRIDFDLVDKEQFAELFKSCYLVIVRTHQDEKRRGAARLITKALLREGDPEKLLYREADHFVRCLDNLSIGAIQVVESIYSLFRTRWAEGEVATPNRFVFRELQHLLEPPSPSLLMGLLGELNSVNLVHILGVPSLREPEYANYAVELSPLGIQFVREVLGGENAA